MFDKLISEVSKLAFLHLETDRIENTNWPKPIISIMEGEKEIQLVESEDELDENIADVVKDPSKKKKKKKKAKKPGNF